MHELACTESCCELQTKATSAPEICCCLRVSNCFAHCPVMYTKNSIKRLHSPAVDRPFDGLLPSSAQSNIPSLKLLQRYRTCALSKFTSDSTFFNTRVCSSLVYLIYFSGKKKGELNRLDSLWLLPLFCFIIWEPSITASVSPSDVEHLSGSFHKQFKTVRLCKY